MSAYYCRLCLTNCAPEESSIFSKDVTEMLRLCIPEIDVNLVNNPIICGDCKTSLKQSTEFKEKCINTQKKILEFKTINKGSLDLSLIKAADGISVSPNSSFDDSFKKFVTSNTSQSDSSDQEVSKIMSKAKEDLMKCDKFLNLLESSTNIRNVLKTPAPTENTKNFDDLPPVLEISAEISKTNRISETKKSSSLQPVDVPIEKDKCLACHKKFPTTDKLVLHLYTQHQKTDELYPCLLCRYKTKALKNMQQHFRTVHKGCTSIVASCVFCITNKNDFRSLLGHLKQDHKDMCKSDRFRCNSCTYVTRSYQTFKRHFLKSHSLICNYCLKEFESVETINRHFHKHAIPKKANVTPNTDSNDKDKAVDPLSLVEVKIENPLF